jgi:FtsP/CotA-like multicopper oxidase with cupredoxin domain
MINKCLSAAVLILLGLVPLAAQAKTVEYSLSINRQIVSVDGDDLKKVTINGTLPGPVLHFTEGDDAIIHVTNQMEDDTSVHWHGLLIPSPMDGAPGFNAFSEIKSGQTFTYRFPIRQSGTYWYHAHSLGQEQDGLYSAIVIDPKEPEPIKADRDYVVLLSDMSSENAQDILKHLKMSSDYYQYHRLTALDFLGDIQRDGLRAALKSANDWGKMRMLRTDLSDISGYYFLMNGKTTDQNWTGLFAHGEKIRLRFINASAMTFFDVRIPGLKMTVVTADGQPIQPVTVDEFRIGNAETYDVIVQPADDKAYTVTAESLDREGFALGTLAPRNGMKGDIPAHRPRARLTMSDMNMDQMMKDDPDMDMSDMDSPSGWAQTGAPKGSKTLSYDDLRYLGTQSDTRETTREITVRLGGTMNRYIWTINGKTFDPADTIDVAYNERVRLTYINETMMAHPFHLHGMFVQLDNGQSPDKLPNKHTVIVPPGQTVSVILTANEPGGWPFHCHLLYHMASGMMTTLKVALPNQPLSLPPDQQPKTMNGGHHDHGQ